eukprot:PLAT9111.1.p1 GENE.PLAT9111.1~~PLAT9111.1.p1  ORF type:complete len:613 (+),score=169.00 PLAT9111.1:203-1840(+)
MGGWRPIYPGDTCNGKDLFAAAVGYDARLMARVYAMLCIALAASFAIVTIAGTMDMRAFILNAITGVALVLHFTLTVMLFSPDLAPLPVRLWGQARGCARPTVSVLSAASAVLAPLVMSHDHFYLTTLGHISVMLNVLMMFVVSYALCKCDGVRYSPKLKRIKVPAFWFIPEAAREQSGRYYFEYTVPLYKALSVEEVVRVAAGRTVRGLHREPMWDFQGIRSHMTCNGVPLREVEAYVCRGFYLKLHGLAAVVQISMVSLIFVGLAGKLMPFGTAVCSFNALVACIGLLAASCMVELLLSLYMGLFFFAAALMALAALPNTGTVDSVVNLPVALSSLVLFILFLSLTQTRKRLYYNVHTKELRLLQQLCFLCCCLAGKGGRLVSDTWDLSTVSSLREISRLITAAELHRGAAWVKYLRQSRGRSMSASRGGSRSRSRSTSRSFSGDGSLTESLLPTGSGGEVEVAGERSGRSRADTRFGEAPLSSFGMPPKVRSGSWSIADDPEPRAPGPVLTAPPKEVFRSRSFGRPRERRRAPDSLEDLIMG